MVDQPDNIVLVYLHRIDEKVDRLSDDVRELRSRMGVVEQGVAQMSGRIDRLADRVERIERRLELSPAQ
jgi:archaellum component FlaC